MIITIGLLRLAYSFFFCDFLRISQFKNVLPFSFQFSSDDCFKLHVARDLHFILFCYLKVASYTTLNSIMYLCVLSHHVCGNLLRQKQKTNISILIDFLVFIHVSLQSVLNITARVTLLKPKSCYSTAFPFHSEEKPKS